MTKMMTGAAVALIMTATNVTACDAMYYTCGSDGNNIAIGGGYQPSYSSQVDDNRVRVGPTTTLTPNAYGMGRSSDQYGRMVRTDPLWQGESEGIFAPNGMVNIWADE